MIVSLTMLDNTQKRCRTEDVSSVEIGILLYHKPIVVILLTTLAVVANGNQGVLEDLNGERSRLTANGIIQKEYPSYNTGKRFLNITASITKVGGTKVVSIRCAPSPVYRAKLDYIYFYFLGWYKVKGGAKKLLAGSFYRDHESKGQNNIRWPERGRWKDEPIYQSAIDMHNSKSYSSGNKYRDFIQVYLPFSVCDPIPGIFECETMSKYGTDWRLWHAADYYSFEGDEMAKPERNCAKKPRMTSHQMRAIRNFSQKKTTLSSVYRLEVRKFRVNVGKNNFAQLDGKVETFRRKKSSKLLELKCTVGKKFLARFKRVHRFYIFWQPNPSVSPVRFLLAGLIRDRPMWVENYNIRSYPHLQRALEQKFWEGSLGSSREAWFRITLPLTSCDSLQGTFQCEVFTEYTRVRKEVITGKYTIPENSVFAKADRKCFEKKKQERKAKVITKSHPYQRYQSRSRSRYGSVSRKPKHITKSSPVRANSRYKARSHAGKVRTTVIKRKPPLSLKPRPVLRPAKSPFSRRYRTRSHSRYGSVSRKPKPITRSRSRYGSVSRKPKPITRSRSRYGSVSRKPKPITRSHSRYSAVSRKPKPITRSHSRYGSVSRKPKPITRSRSRYGSVSRKPKAITRSHSRYGSVSRKPKAITRSHSRYGSVSRKPKPITRIRSRYGSVSRKPKPITRSRSRYGSVSRKPKPITRSHSRYGSVSRKPKPITRSRSRYGTVSRKPKSLTTIRSRYGSVSRKPKPLTRIRSRYSSVSRKPKTRSSSRYGSVNRKWLSKTKSSPLKAKPPSKASKGINHSRAGKVRTTVIKRKPVLYVKPKPVRKPAKSPFSPRYRTRGRFRYGSVSRKPKPKTKSSPVKARSHANKVRTTVKRKPVLYVKPKTVRKPVFKPAKSPFSPRFMTSSRSRYGSIFRKPKPITKPSPIKAKSQHKSSKEINRSHAGKVQTAVKKTPVLYIKPKPVMKPVIKPGPQKQTVRKNIKEERKVVKLTDKSGAPQKVGFQKQEEIKDIEAEQERIAKLKQKSDESQIIDTGSDSKPDSVRAPSAGKARTAALVDAPSKDDKTADKGSKLLAGVGKKQDNMGLYVGIGAAVVLVIVAAGIACAMSNKNKSEGKNSHRQASYDEPYYDDDYGDDAGYEEPPRRKPPERGRGRGRGRGGGRGRGRGRGRGEGPRSMNNSSLNFHKHNMRQRSSVRNNRSEVSPEDFQPSGAPDRLIQDEYDNSPQNIYPPLGLKSPGLPSRTDFPGRSNSHVISQHKPVTGQFDRTHGPPPVQQLQEPAFVDSPPRYSNRQIVGQQYTNDRTDGMTEQTQFDISPQRRNHVDTGNLNFQVKRELPDDELPSNDGNPLAMMLNNRLNTLRLNNKTDSTIENRGIRPVQNVPSVSTTPQYGPRMPAPNGPRMPTPNNLPLGTPKPPSNHGPPMQNVNNGPVNRATLMQSIRLRRVGSISAPNLSEQNF